MKLSEYAKQKGITRQAALQRIDRAIKHGTNKLKDGSYFEKIGHNYIIEINN
jgi:hypothetical protein